MITVCCCLKQLSFGLLCYTVVEKLYAWVDHNVLRDKIIYIISERALTITYIGSAEPTEFISTSGKKTKTSLRGTKEFSAPQMKLL